MKMKGGAEMNCLRPEPRHGQQTPERGHGVGLAYRRAGAPGRRSERGSPDRQQVCRRQAELGVSGLHK